MSVLNPLGRGSSLAATNNTRSTPPSSARDDEIATRPADDLMSQDGADSEKSVDSGLAPHEDARALVRLVQCKQCSRPFRTPVTLPCGNSLCRECLPESHHREGLITWPDMALRRQAIRCPFPECAKEHPVADYAVDVVLSKVMEAISEEVAKHTSLNVEAETTVEEVARWDEVMADSSEKGRFHNLQGGRLLSTFTLAAEGKLGYNIDLNSLNSPAEDSDPTRELDKALLADLVESAHREVDCQVCYRLMLDPVTTVCGHSLCRSCMARVLDHSQYCPVCRRSMSIATSVERQESNKALNNLLAGLCPNTVASRAEALRIEALGGDGELNVPLFVCTLAFPHQPTFLRIFEPRYRLMLRRCLEGNGEFGILMYNQYREPQGDLGPVHFYHYGTMLRIVDAQLLNDGTSLIETYGAYRIRVTAFGEVDGYGVGKVERVEDVSLAEEERIEMEETSQREEPQPQQQSSEQNNTSSPSRPQTSSSSASTAEAATNTSAATPSLAESLPSSTSTTTSNTTTTSSSTPSQDDAQAELDRLPTEELFQRARDFIARMQQRSAPWLQQRVLSVHGQPPEDAAVFPYWFASVLPIAEEEKYKLLATRTVRERLKMIAGWIRRIEGQRWPPPIRNLFG